MSASPLCLTQSRRQARKPPTILSAPSSRTPAWLPCRTSGWTCLPNMYHPEKVHPCGHRVCRYRRSGQGREPRRRSGQQVPFPHPRGATPSSMWSAALRIRISSVHVDGSVEPAARHRNHQSRADRSPTSKRSPSAAEQRRQDAQGGEKSLQDEAGAARKAAGASG